MYFKTDAAKRDLKEIKRSDSVAEVKEKIDIKKALFSLANPWVSPATLITLSYYKPMHI